MCQRIVKVRKILVNLPKITDLQNYDLLLQLNKKIKNKKKKWKMENIIQIEIKKL